MACLSVRLQALFERLLLCVGALAQDKRTIDFLIRKEDEKGGPRKQRIVVEDNIKKLHQMVCNP